MRFAGCVAYERYRRNAYKILVGIPKIKPHARPRRRWEGHNRMDPKGTGQMIC
jgi:hypothetical protein